MTNAQRLLTFGLAVAVVFGVGAAIGAAVGPVGPSAPMDHHTGMVPTQITSKALR